MSTAWTHSRVFTGFISKDLRRKAVWPSGCYKERRRWVGSPYRRLAGWVIGGWPFSTGRGAQPPYEARLKRACTRRTQRATAFPFPTGPLITCPNCASARAEAQPDLLSTIATSLYTSAAGPRG